jgi:hypothetical protein
MGDPVHHLVFANPDAVETWFEEKDLEGVAFEYEVLEWTVSTSVPESTRNADIELNEGV